MVELITVMVIIGILSALAIPRLMGSNAMAGTAFRNQVVSALRYAQKSAVSHRRTVCAELEASQVTLKIDTSNDTTFNCDTTLASPIDAPYASTDSAVVASGSLVDKTLFFHPNGTISDEDGAIVSGSISIDANGASDSSISIEGATGYVD